MMQNQEQFCCWEHMLCNKKKKRMGPQNVENLLWECIYKFIFWGCEFVEMLKDGWRR